MSAINYEQLCQLLMEKVHVWNCVSAQMNIIYFCINLELEEFCDSAD